VTVVTVHGAVDVGVTSRDPEIEDLENERAEHVRRHVGERAAKTQEHLRETGEDGE